MKLVLLPIASLLSLSIPNSAVDVGPLVSTLEYTVSQFTTVVAEVKVFDGSKNAADRLIRHAEETMQTMDTSIRQIANLPAFNMSTATSVAATGNPLQDRASQLKRALTAKKSLIEKANIGGKM